MRGQCGEILFGRKDIKVPAKHTFRTGTASYTKGLQAILGEARRLAHQEPISKGLDLRHVVSWSCDQSGRHRNAANQYSNAMLVEAEHKLAMIHSRLWTLA